VALAALDSETELDREAAVIASERARRRVAANAAWQISLDMQPHDGGAIGLPEGADQVRRQDRIRDLTEYARKMGLQPHPTAIKMVRRDLERAGQRGMIKYRCAAPDEIEAGNEAPYGHWLGDCVIPDRGCRAHLHRCRPRKESRQVVAYAAIPCACEAQGALDKLRNSLTSVYWFTHFLSFYDARRGAVDWFRNGSLSVARTKSAAFSPIGW
jgi:hypothetical protein